MKVTSNVTMLESTFSSHVYLVFTPQPVLIDTGMSFAGKGIRREIGALCEPGDIRHILLTHHDVDHIGNAAWLQQWTGAAVYASATDIPYITGEKERHSFKKYIGRLSHVKPPEALQPLPDSGEICGITVVASPGHTPGHVCFMFDDVLFAGDLLEHKKGKLIPYPAAWNWDDAALKESVERVRALPFTWVCPAHGSPVRRADAGF
jgi:glyoxylase-like metal-dependent hydrolase (beta-lactamase superfamily II)